MKKKMIMKGVFLFFILFSFSLNVMAAIPAKVYVIPVESEIDSSMAGFVERCFREAEELQAELVILEIDTPGGYVDSAMEIKNTISSSSVPTIAFVKGWAISGGAYITLACPKIAMVPGSAIGDAEPRLGDERADEKIISGWAGEMGTTAEKNGRDREIAKAMVDRDIEIPNLVEKGKLLTLTYKQAEQYGYTDYVVQDRAELLKVLKLENAEVIEGEFSLAEIMSRIVTNPYISPFLLMIGIAGIVIEVFTMGFGVAGFLGLASLGLYFGGHLLAGFSGWEAILLFLLGIILLGVEMFFAGFGFFGLSGIICVVLSIIFAAPSWEAGIVSLVIAMIGTIILVMISFKVLTKRKLWDHLILGTKYKTEDGYIPQKDDLSIYIGKKGEALTALRPAGTVILDDGARLDVVTDGGFIQKGERIEVCGAEGIRLIVRVLREEEKEKENKDENKDEEV